MLFLPAPAAPVLLVGIALAVVAGLRGRVSSADLWQGLDLSLLVAVFAARRVTRLGVYLVPISVAAALGARWLFS